MNDTKNDNYYIKIAEQVATNSTCNARDVGAVIVKNNKVIATGYNNTLNGQSCKERGFCYHNLNCNELKDIPSRSVHAEIVAIINCSQQGVSCVGATIYVTHEPCLNCLKAIATAGISYIVYKNKLKKNKKMEQYRLNFIQENNIKIYRL